MEMQLKAKRMGGSIGIIIPQIVITKERIQVNDSINIKIEKTADLSFMFGKGKGIKKSTSQIMNEIDEGEYD